MNGKQLLLTEIMERYPKMLALLRATQASPMFLHNNYGEDCLKCVIEHFLNGLDGDK